MLYFVDIVLKLEWPINVRRYYGSSKVRGEGNSVIFINREILPRPQDASICFTFFQWNSKKYSEDYDYLWNTAVDFDLF